MLYLKGYKVDMQRVLSMFNFADWLKGIDAIRKVVPREEYLYISGTRCKDPQDGLEFVFVVDDGYDKEELERKPFEEPEGYYSRGQAKPTNLVSRQGKYLGPKFSQILVQICEIRRKTHLRSFSHEELAWPEFWT
ncbi:hypothetical protein M413DRAFT_25506 [Hebeloma cylindrosporum]|uniref:Uncharacterized protein n=1 Tax=Hebeloma cylindrosporum TaxID=76867 RepID=A0A0C2Y2E7_HEBCY|nr:hypothetical protein M413DRAFT_25506 [Hebeloma cylindrosporum h7]